MSGRRPFDKEDSTTWRVRSVPVPVRKFSGQNRVYRPEIRMIETLKASAGLQFQNSPPRKIGNSRRTARSICHAPNPRTKSRGALPQQESGSKSAGFTARPPGQPCPGGDLPILAEWRRNYCRRDKWLPDNPIQTKQVKTLAKDQSSDSSQNYWKTTSRR